MSIHAPKLKRGLTVNQNQAFSINPLRSEPPCSPQSHSQLFELLHTVLDGIDEGVLVISPPGLLIHANRQARVMMKLIEPNPSSIPQEFRQICQTLVRRYIFSPQKPRPESVSESTILTTPNGELLYIQASWLGTSLGNSSYFLLRITNPQTILQHQAMIDSHCYQLTPREREIWLLRCSKHSYRDIADRLCITPNTVKKHVKSIRAKQRQALPESVEEGSF